MKRASKTFLFSSNTGHILKKSFDMLLDYALPKGREDPKTPSDKKEYFFLSFHFIY